MTKRKLFDISWKLALLALPWQTRWFHDASLAGWPWEQGRWSVYASWFLIVAAIVLGFSFMRRSLTGPKKRRASYFFAALFACTVVPILFHSDQPARFVAVSQWWIQVLLLFGFGLTLTGANVQRRSVAFWFVLSLIPHAMLGAAQYATQIVVGSKWLGMATHLAETPGTSVIEFGVWRYLRVYGGFPHPNIFGGWLAVGLVASLFLAGASESKKRAIFAIAVSAFFSVVLLLTFSRSAWIAAAVGIVILVGARFPRPPIDRQEGRGNPVPTNQFFFVALAVSFLSVLIIGLSQRAVVFARADATSRLETKSIDERSQSLADGIALFKMHPIFGAGPNAELLDLRSLDAQRVATSTVSFRASQPLEPPHNVPLLAIVDFGIAGLLLFVGFLTRTIHRVPRSVWSFVSLLILLGLFDHYLWSSWSGASLALILAILCVLTHEPA